MACTQCPSNGYQPGTSWVAQDYIDGYPAEYGWFNFTVGDYDFTDENSEFSKTLIGQALGLELEVGTHDSLFKLGSGIKVDASSIEYRYWKPYRLDCGCLKYECETTNTIAVDCPANSYIKSNGDFDFNCDGLDMIPVMSFIDTIGVCDGSILSANDINNLFVIDPSVSHTSAIFNGIPLTGTICNYTDSYGILYSYKWTITGDMMDLITVIKDPRVPGEPDSGHVEAAGNGFVVYRRGVVSLQRQILKATGNGYVILSEGNKAEIKEFQSKFQCEDTSSPFYYNLECGVTESVEFLSGTETIIKSPPDPTDEAIFYPAVISGTEDGFYLPGENIGPLDSIDPPEEFC